MVFVKGLLYGFIPLHFYTSSRVVFSDGSAPGRPEWSAVSVGGERAGGFEGRGVLTWVPRSLGGAGGALKEGFAGHPGVLKGPEALSLLDLLSPETAPRPTTGSQPVTGCTHRWDECPWREKARMDIGFLARGLTTQIMSSKRR